MSPTARVLIVDPSRESRDLLRSLLARSGAEVLEARETSRAAQLAAAEPPHLIVVDAESGSDCEDSAKQLAATAARNDVPIVVLGTYKRCVSPFPTEEFIAKPYQYAALIRRIEELLGSRL